jgi:hypothetical protein
MIGKLAAVEINTDKKKKFELSWYLSHDRDKRVTSDTLFDCLTKFYDMLNESKDNNKPFSVTVAGKSFKIDPADYGYFDKELKEVTEKRVQKDYSASKCENVPCTGSNSKVKKMKIK